MSEVYFSFLCERAGAAHSECYSSHIMAAVKAGKIGAHPMQLPYTRVDAARNQIVDKFMEVFSIDNALDKTDVTHFINLCAMVNRGEIVVEHGELFPGKRQPLSNQEFISKLE